MLVAVMAASLLAIVLIVQAFLVLWLATRSQNAQHACTDIHELHAQVAALNARAGLPPPPPLAHCGLLWTYG